MPYPIRTLGCGAKAQVSIEATSLNPSLEAFLSILSVAKLLRAGARGTAFDGS
jgi:hypothetical protein